MKKRVIDSISRQLSPNERLKEQVVHATSKLKYGKKTVETDIEETQSGMINTDSQKLPEGEFSVLKSRWGIYASAAAVFLAVAAVSAVAMFGGTRLSKNNNESSGSGAENSINSESTESESPEIIEMTKEELYSKMINSMYYFDTVQGEYIYTWSDLNEAILCSFKSDSNKATALCKTVSVKISDPLAVLGSDVPNHSILPEVDIRYVCDGEQKVSYNAKTDSYDRNYSPPYKRSNYKEPDKEPEEIYGVVSDENGIPSSAFLPDTTNLSENGIWIFPKEFAFAYLYDFKLWYIEGYEIYLNRGCAVISGTTEDQSGLRQNAVSFKMYIDCKTGVMLKYLGFDENDELSRYSVVQSINFDKPIPEITMADLETGYADN